MTTVLVQAKLTTEDLIAAIDQLEQKQAEGVIRRLLHLQARRRVPEVSERERELLHEIFREKRSGFQERYDVLSARSRSFTLNPEEQQEYLSLVDESEAFTVRRLEALG